MASPAAAAAAAAASHEAPTGGHESLEGLWGSLGVQAAQRSSHFSCLYRAVPCYRFLRPPPFCLLTQPAPAPCELTSGALQLWPGPLLYSPLLQPGVPEDALRAKAGHSRESTAALKAWLGQHRKNPYPSKGEKVLLALVSRMSLTQVSTWFANARRRLKKENRACWARQSPKTEEEEEEKVMVVEEEEEEGTGEAVAHSSLRPKSRPLQGPQGVWDSEQGPRRLPLGTTSNGRMDQAPLPPKAMIWCVAELATSPTPGRAEE